MLANMSQPNPVVNLNFQQPYYQTMAYGLNITPMGSGVPHGPVPDVLFPRTPAYGMPNTRIDGEMNDGVRGQIARTLHEFGFLPNGGARAYRKPYPEFYDTIPYPRGVQVPDLAKFTGDDAKATYEHVGHFLVQVNDIGIIDMHKVRLFLLSLTRTAFNWFTSLPPNSVDTWASLE
jgi:hypothetical protein